MHKWSENELNLLKEYYITMGPVAMSKIILLELSPKQIRYKAQQLGLLSKAIGAPKKYTEEQLIKILQDSEIKTYDYFNHANANTPAGTTYREYFGSWGNALKAAGLGPNNCTMKPNKLTRIYLVEFDGFYKIGITQQTIQQRLGGRYPKYEVILNIETTYEDAKNIETLWLNNVKDYKFIPDNFPPEGRGFTECFKYE